MKVIEETNREVSEIGCSTSHDRNFSYICDGT